MVRGETDENMPHDILERSQRSPSSATVVTAPSGLLALVPAYQLLSSAARSGGVWMMTCDKGLCCFISGVVTPAYPDLTEVRLVSVCWTHRSDRTQISELLRTPSADGFEHQLSYDALAVSRAYLSYLLDHVIVLLAHTLHKTTAR